jgi:hypothetical protein
MLSPQSTKLWQVVEILEAFQQPALRLLEKLALSRAIAGIKVVLKKAP